MTVFVPEQRTPRLFFAIVALLVTMMSPWSLRSVSARESGLLSVDQAFPLRARQEADRIVVFVDVLPGHYLYRDRIELKFNGRVVPAGMLKGLPEGRSRNDPHFGVVHTLEQPFQLTLGMPRGKTQARHEVIELTLDYQGCSELTGVCYPPTRRHFRLVEGGREVLPEESQRSATSGLGAMFRKQVSQ